MFSSGAGSAPVYFADGTARSYVVNSLTPGATVTFFVAGTTAAFPKGGALASVQLSTPCSTPPAAPANVQAFGVSPSAIQVRGEHA